MSGDQSSVLIAIVDDDQSVQRALQDLIESEGLSTVCFGSAEEFLDSGVQDSAGCLIADIRMSGISGVDLQAKLKADRCRVPIIFITAHGDAKMRIQAMREGAVEFLTKPFDNAVLLETVHAAVKDYAKTLGLRTSNQCQLQIKTAGCADSSRSSATAQLLESFSNKRSAWRRRTRPFSFRERLAPARNSSLTRSTTRVPAAASP